MIEPKCIVCGARLEIWNLRFTRDHDGPLCSACLLVSGNDPSPATGEGIDVTEDMLDGK